MKSAQAFYYAFMTYVTGLLAVTAFGFGLLFAGFGQNHKGMLALGLCVLLALLSLIYRQLGKPKSWSGPQHYTLR